MSSNAVKLAQEMLDTIQLLISENEKLKDDVKSLNGYVSLLEDNVDYLQEMNSHYEKDLKRNSLSESDLKMIRFLVHPDRSRKDTQDLFCKVNSLIKG